MATIKTIAELLKQIGKSEQLRSAALPLGYTPGLPILAVRNGYLVLLVPYLKYKVTGQVDKTLVYPTRFVVEAVLPEGRIVKTEDLAYNPLFGKVEFNRPVGFFRHDAIKHLNKEAYTQKRAELLAEYDKVVAHLIDGAPYTTADEARMRSLLQLLIEPSLLPFYKVFNKPFFNKYIADAKD